MAVYRRSKRNRFVLVLLVLTSVTAISLDFGDTGSGVVGSARTGLREAFAPVQQVIGGTFGAVGDFFGGLTRYGSLRADNARLRRELDQVKGERLAAADAERERRLLLALQGLDFTGALQSISARVVAVSPSNSQLTITIDRGTRQGIDVGMPVVSESGLVGRVSEVATGRSTVLLITDPSSSVGVRLTGSGEVGVITGAGPTEDMAVDLVSLDTKVDPGEPVVTSGLQKGLFPPQIPVGRVVRVRKPPGALSQEVTIEPAVDLDRLELVKVLVWKPEP